MECYQGEVQEPIRVREKHAGEAEAKYIFHPEAVRGPVHGHLPAFVRTPLRRVCLFSDPGGTQSQRQQGGSSGGCCRQLKPARRHADVPARPRHTCASLKGLPGDPSLLRNGQKERRRPSRQQQESHSDFGPEADHAPSESVSHFRPSVSRAGGGQETSSLELPHFLSSMTATSSVCPCCVGCGSSMKWDDWHRDASALNIGLGKFYSRCVLCQANDALFKDGSLS